MLDCDRCSLLKIEICHIISPEIEKVVTQNVTFSLELPLSIPVPNFIMIGVS